MEFIDLKTQLAHIRPEIDKRIAQVLDHGQFIMGPEVKELEAELASYCGVKYCVTCANGTDALQLALMGLGIKPGDIVFTTAFSFFATAEVIALVGAIPFFVDIDKGSFNIDPNSLRLGIAQAEKQYPGKSRAVIAVDIFGLPANYPELESICQEHNLYLIEDAAQSFGASLKQQKTCSFGDVATTSFFPAKPLGCFGDGGALFTNDAQLAQLCSSLRLHGKGAHKYQNVHVGLNSRLDTIQAAVLLEKLKYFDSELISREKIANYYAQQLPDNLTMQQQKEGYVSAWAQFSVLCNSIEHRHKIQSTLAEKGIPTGVYYPIPLNAQPALQSSPGLTTPVSNDICERVLSFPMHPYLAEQQIDTLCQQIE